MKRKKAERKIQSFREAIYDPDEKARDAGTDAYTRVLPRDLFNESKLLKCLGRLALLIHEGEAPGLTCEHDGTPFDVRQDPSDGGLYAVNVQFMLGGRRLDLKSSLNSKEAYPLVVDDPKRGPVHVFDENGEFTEEFDCIIDDLHRVEGQES